MNKYILPTIKNQIFALVGLILISLLGMGNRAYSQGTCATAIAVTSVLGTCPAPPYATALTTVAAGLGVVNGPAPATPCPTNLATAAVAGWTSNGWASFVALGTTTTVNFNNTSRDVGLWVFSGTCPGALTQIACADVFGGGNNTESVTISTVIGQTYYVRVCRKSTANNNVAGTICVSHTAAPANDEPCTATNLGALPTSCNYTSSSTTGATITSTPVPPAPGCANYLGNDVWFTTNASAAGNITVDTRGGVTAGANMTNGGMAIYTGTCGALVLRGCDDNNSVNPGGMPYLSLTGLGANAQVWIRVWANNINSWGAFDICAYDVPAACNVWDNPCTTPYSFPAITAAVFCSPTFNNTCATNTTGTGLGTPTCAPFSYSGADVWFKFVAPAGGAVTIYGQAGSMTDAMMALYSASGACPTPTFAQLYCDDDSGPGLMPQIDATGLTPGATYYVRVWGYFGASGTFSLCVNSPCSAPPVNDECTSATPLTLGAACPATYTTACASNSAQASPGCANYQGGDVWFSVTVPASGSIIATGVAGGITDGGMAIYNGTCPGGLGLLGCDDDSGPGLSPELTLSGLTPFTTIYIRYWRYGGGTGGSFGLCVSDPCPSGVPANDLPCNASFLPYNVFIPGTNGCATNTSDPASLPACFTNASAGQWNTVWYRFIATSACTKIKTSLGTLNNTQIAVYSGAGGCAALGAPLACNNDVTPCGGGSFTYQYSQLDMATTPGTTYYIMVDGVNGQTGTYSIQVIDGVSWTGSACSASFPPITGQDCALPIPVCSATINVANPGFQAVGNVCDFAPPGSCTTDGNLGCSPGGGNPCGTTCLCTGERGSVWYDISIAGASGSFLEFNIVPNDYTGTAGFETDYDFALFGPFATASAANCASLTSPIRCSFSALGVTGINGPGVFQAPALYAPNYNGAFRERVAVLPGEHYLLNVSNFSTSASGFALNFAASSIATTVPPGSTLIWTGAVSTNWHDINNWGGCQVPDCRYNVNIPSFPANQPLISTGDASCRNMDIQVGATVSMNTNRTLMVCNNFTNNGTFTAALGTTVLIQDTCTTCTVPVAGINHNQTLTGSMTGVNRFPHLTTVKPAGFGAISINDLDVGGNFTVSGAAGFGGNFNATGQYQKVAGNFTVQVAPLVATYTPALTLEFNGAGTAQTYLNRGFLKSVVMNQSGAVATATVTLQDHSLVGTPWMQLDNTGALTLTYGRIMTAFGHATDNRVDVLNTAPAAVSSGNINSYVNGTLRRYLLTTGAYDFPVGVTTAAKGFERINFNFTTALPGTISYWNVFFDEATNPASPVFATECSSDYHNTKLALNHGIWSVKSNPATLASGKVTITNYNRGWGNALGAGWTVQYNNAASNVVANWLLSPFPASPCAAPPVTAVLRNNMDVATMFSSATNPVWFASAQSDTPLPVKLLSFDAKATKNSIKLNWATASEQQNKGFELQRTVTPPDNFDKLAWLDGHGTTTTTNYYNFEDKDVKEGIIYYYRLKQEDFNGNSDLSNVVAANIGRSFVFNVIPNPYSGSTNITYSLQEDSKVKIEVMNVMGQRVATIADAVQEAGSYRYDFSAKLYGYSSGIYTIRVLVNDQVYSKRVLEKD